MAFTVSTFPVLLFVYNFIFFLYIAISSLKRYYNLRYTPDLLLGVSFTLLLITETSRLLSAATNNPSEALLYFRVVNAILMPAVALWFLAFTFYYRGKLSVLSVIVVYLTGLLGGGFLFSDDIKVTYDTATQNWNGVYPTSFFLIIAPLILIAFFRIIQPLIRKIQYIEDQTDQTTLTIMSVGISLVLLWGISSAFTSNDYIRIIRPVFLATGWLVWYLASKRNPFFLSASRAQPQRLFITDSTGQLYFSHDFTSTEGASSMLLAPLVQAVNNMAFEVFQTSHGVKSFIIGNREVVSLSYDNYYFHLIGNNLDDAIRGVFTQFSLHVLDELKEVPAGEYIDLEDEIDNYFNRLIIIEDEHHKVEIETDQQQSRTA